MTCVDTSESLSEQVLSEHVWALMCMCESLILCLLLQVDDAGLHMVIKDKKGQVGTLCARPYFADSQKCRLVLRMLMLRQS